MIPHGRTGIVAHRPGASTRAISRIRICARPPWRSRRRGGGTPWGCAPESFRRPVPIMTTDITTGRFSPPERCGACVVSENNPAGRPILTLDDLARPLTRRPERIHALTQAELAIAFSQGLDLAEGKHLGHAQRVYYIAALIAEELGLEPQQRNAVFFAALLHDIGVPLAASEICRIAGVDEETIFGPSPLKAPEELKGALSFADLSTVVEAVHQHAVVGAATVRNLDLPEDVAAAVRAHHERWDGFGFPEGLSRDAAPIEARIVAAADVAESLIA